ncbi:hypothetical protein AAHC03_0675 [Spirometra sp. Aus1]
MGFSNKKVQEKPWLPTPIGKERNERLQHMSTSSTHSFGVSGYPPPKSQALAFTPQSRIDTDVTTSGFQHQVESADRKKPRHFSSSKSEGWHRRLPRKEDAIYNARYKSQPCLHYQKYKRCPLGEDCHFAHGPAELQHPQCHPKFRTRPCKNFLLTGSCPFGSACYFLHYTELAPIELSCLRLLDD